MKNIVLKLLLIVLILASCVWLIVPPQEKIRLGKDLRGGVSLIYSVRMDADTRDRQAVLNQTIQVLQERVNPQGVLDISMEPVGDDRIEVIMPLPSEDVLQLRDAFERELDALLREAQISPGRLDTALRHNQAPQQFGGDPDSERGRLVLELQEAYNRVQAERDALDEMRDRDADSRELVRQQQAVAAAMIEFEDLRDDVLRLSLDRSRILRVLELSPEGTVLRDERNRPRIDPETGEVLTTPSPREIELQALSQEFPQLIDSLRRTAEAYDAYQVRRTGFDGPEDLKRLLRGAGVLEYRIAVRPGADDVNISDLRRQLAERGAENVDSPVAGWFEINDLAQWYDQPEQLDFLLADPAAFLEQRNLVAAERDGRYFLLLYDAPGKKMTHEGDRRWSVQAASRGIDELGLPAVLFRLDSTGGMLMSRLTGPHVGEPMAIVLDGQVYSAPVLRSQIGSRGQITGSFTPAEISYLIRVLAAGALEARLSDEPIAENTLGPSIGADNLRRGMEAFVIALIAIAMFMTLYYFFAGLVAVFALVANGLIIFGVMSMIDGMFTMPGLAGIVLTIGMAVDANVLIYERIREELFSGEWDLRGAIRQGYAKAMSTIVDANVTNLIVCIVLLYAATTEVKGFAMTLSIGIGATLFTTLFVTRQIYYLYTDFFNARSLPMLATVFPAIHHFLEPSIKWLSLRKIFWAASAVAIVSSVVLVGSRGVDMFDTELRGGVAATMRTAPLDEDALEEGERIWLQHVGPGSVEERIRAIGQRIDAEAARDEMDRDELILREFRNASVLTVGRSRTNEAGFVEAQSFQIKVPNPRGMADDEISTDVVVQALVHEFGDLLDMAPPLDFDGAGSPDHTRYTYAIEHDELGQNIGEPRLTDRVPEFLGGVAVVLRDISPPATVEEIESRIERMRGQPDFGVARGRDVRVFGLIPADPADLGRGYREVVVAVYDPAYSIMRVDYNSWDQNLAQVEWRLMSEALSRPPSLEQVASYSPQVARTLAAAAQVAVLLALAGILLYIWVRFGSFRYSMAAIAALMHDVTIALGVLALTAYLGRTAFGQFLLIEEFRIDLGVVAALLTIIGYSLNDTIVILDRIRENRGKALNPSDSIINRSINQTLSRTIITSFTTLMAILIMYIEGGSGIRSFAFTLMVGLIVGTYSSIAIASPLVRSTGKQPQRKTGEEEIWRPGEPEPTA